MNRVSSRIGWTLTLALGVTPVAWSQGESKTVYRCPGNPVLYTDALSAKEARDKGCRTLEGAPITVVQSTKPRTSSATASSAPRPADQRVDPNDQRNRDSDARRILEAELKREEERLAQMQKDYN